MGLWWTSKSSCGSGSRVVLRSNYSMHEEVYWRSRLSAAFRTGWACFMAGLILQVGSMHVQWVTFPIFAYVMAVTVVGESTFGKALQDAVAVATGTAQGVGMSLLVLQALPPGKYFCSIGVAIACISVSSFVITFPKATHILHKRVALAHSGIIYVTAVVQREHMDEVFFPLKLAGTTIVGATCGMLALLVPLPRLAIFQVHSQTKLSARITSERLKVLVDAFCAKDTTRASALNLQAKSLAKIGSTVHAEITSIEGDMGWETRRFPCRSSQNLQRVTKGLTSLRKTLVGLELALQADLASSASNKQTRFLHHMMTESLIYLTDWVFLALRHASTDIKSRSTTSHTQRQVIIEEGNEVLSSFDEALSATRQKVEYLATGELDTSMGSILGEVLSQNRSDTDDESHDSDDGDISHHTDKDDGAFFSSDSEMIELMCNTARQQLAYRIAAAEVGEAASADLDQISMGHEIPRGHGSLGAIITHHMQGSSDGSFGSSLMPDTMGAHLSFEAQSAAFFFLFNVKKFVEGTKGILLSSGNSRVSPQAFEQSKLFQVQMLEAPSAQDPHVQSTPHFKVQVSTHDHQIQPHSYMQHFVHHHSLPTGHIHTQFSTSHDHKSPSLSLPASTQNASVSQNKPLANLCAKCIASTASGVKQSKQMAPKKQFSIPFKLRSQQLKTAFKMSLAMAIGAFLGFWFNNKKGYWADITLALGFTGPAKGGSFKIAVLRTLGTVSGSIYGLLVVLATVNFPVMRLVALIPWVIFTSFLRQSKIFGYAGAVSAFTGAIVILVARTNKDSTDQEFTVIRIVEAFLGMASFLIVEMLVFPRRAASMVKPEIIAGLGKLQEFVSAIFDAYSSPHCDVCSGSVAIDELKIKERKLRSVISRQNELVKEAAEEPQFWFAPFPAQIFSKVMEEQGKIMEMLHFSISALEEIKQVAEETKIPMDRLLQAPLKAAMTIMEEKVVPTLAFLVKVMAIRAQQGVPIETPGPQALSGANFAAASKSAADLEAGQRFVELESLMMAESTARNSRVFKYCQFGDVALKRERRFMDAFERGTLHVAYELEASGASFCQGTCTHPNHPPPCLDPLSNTLFLSLGTLAFSLSGLLHHTTELEKVVHELLQEENPWNLIDFWDTSKSMGHLWPK